MSVMQARRALLGRPPRVLLSDSMTRADSALTMGSAETGQAWAPQFAGTWGISSNQATSVTDAGGQMTVIDAGRADGRVSCTINGLQAQAVNFRWCEIVLRFLDTSNYLLLQPSTGAVRLLKDDATVFTTLASASVTVPDATDVQIAALLLGNTVQVLMNGALLFTYVLTAGDTKYSAYTKHGLRLNKGGVPVGTARWDTFLVTDR